MAAPVAQAREIPQGFMLLNGYQALITFAADPYVELWEKVVTPPALDYGEKIDVTTQHNSTVRTAAIRNLAEVKDGKFTCAYDPKFYNFLRSPRVFGVETTVTYTYPDGSTLAYFGAMTMFEPDGQEEGKQPDATVVIKATNRDPDYGPCGPEGPGLGTGTGFIINEWLPVYTPPDCP